MEYQKVSFLWDTPYIAIWSKSTVGFISVITDALPTICREQVPVSKIVVPKFRSKPSRSFFSKSKVEIRAIHTQADQKLGSHSKLFDKIIEMSTPAVHLATNKEPA